MSAVDECVVAGLKVRIDRDLCVGFGDCITEAPDAFDFDGGGVVVFGDPQAVDRARLLKACHVCPVDALSVWDEQGVQIVP